MSVRRHGTRLYQWLTVAVRFVYDRPALLALLPFAVFFPLLDSRGLYEYGDANFPLNPFWADYMLPWSGAASAGADNTFIGVPRLVYHLGINLLIAVFHNLQVAQWIWYSSMTVLGLLGAYALARRLGAGVYSVPLAIFYALNLWSYDRIAQGLMYLSYQALPLVVFLFLKYLRRPTMATALYFACSLLLVIPALQVSYLAVVICLAIAVREVLLRGARAIEPLLGLAAAVVAANAFYIFSMVADLRFNAGGNIALVNQRFTIGTFLHYATNIGIFNTLRLQSFYYTSIARQPFLVALGCAILPLLLLGLVLLARRPALRSPFYLGLFFALFGLWLVDGIVVAPAAYTWFHFAVPGMRSFVEPDYFSPLYIFGAFVMLAAALRVAVRAYGGACRIAVWILALSGIVPFLPVSGGASGMPQTGQPRQYRTFSQSHVQGNTLWLPPDRGVQYRWSPYTINGFTSLNSPSDALGPAMAESVAPGTLRVQARLSDAFLSVQPKTARALAPIMGVGTIAIAADSYSPSLQWPDPEVTSSLETLALLQRSGFIAARSDNVDVNVRLVTATTRPPQPEIGVYDEPVDAGGYENFMWRAVLEPSAAYTPVAADLAPGTSFGDVRLPQAPAPVISQRTVPVSEFRDCAHQRRHPQITGASLFVQTYLQPRCFSLPLPKLARVAALQAVLDAQPLGAAQIQLDFLRGRHGAIWVDPQLPAQEVPVGVRSAHLTVHVPPYAMATLRGATLRWAAPNAAPPILPPRTCSASRVTWSEQNPLAYTVEATLSGRCTVVFRQSFAPIWRLQRVRGTAAILGHVQIDGFANGWIVNGSGPVTFRIVNLTLIAYAGGMVLTIACLLLALGLAVRSALARTSLRAGRVQSPA
ncbi:MAG: hypothetical protein WCD38_13295 [Candidatus Tumulicola sp.]